MQKLMVKSARFVSLHQPEWNFTFMRLYRLAAYPTGLSYFFNLSGSAKL